MLPSRLLRATVGLAHHKLGPAFMSSATDQVQHVAHGLRAMADSLRSPADLQRLSEELKQLISSAKSQEDAIEQVQAGTEQATNTTSSSPQPAQQRKAKKQRVVKEFVFSNYRQRHVALEILYIGWKYHGFARQPTTEDTIEGHFFRALRQQKLIPEDADIATLNYSRCGRTDAGVSALGQVVALKLRSNARADSPDDLPEEQEMDYPSIINKALPEDIRVLGWTTAREDFSARFSCSWRQYKYFIVQDGSLDLERMRQAAQLLQGEHDFRNFCKVDVANVRNFRRKILDMSIEPAGPACGGLQVYALVVRGTAFLYHQVRCMAAVLLMVGRGQEEPGVVSQLLDVAGCARKPQYNMASELPLILYACAFEGLRFRRGQRQVDLNVAVVGAMLQRHLVGAAMAHAVGQRLQQDGQQLAAGGQQQGRQGGRGSSGGAHIPLMKRAREPSLEERFAKAGIDPSTVLQQYGGGATAGAVGAAAGAAAAAGEVAAVPVTV